MDSLTVSVVLVPGIVALLLFLIFSYLYQQTRQDYFRAWQLGWAAYTLYYALDAWSAFHSPSSVILLLSSLLLAAMAFCIYASTRLMREHFRLQWQDIVLACSAVALSIWNLHAQSAVTIAPASTISKPMAVGVAAVLLYCSAYFFRWGSRKNSLAFKLLAMALALWAVLMAFAHAGTPYVQLFDLFGPIPQLSLGIAMVLVLAENERNAVQENALAFSTLGVDPMRLLSAEDLLPSMQSILERLLSSLPTRRAVICISERWRAILPSVQYGFTAEFVSELESTGGGEYVSELAYRRGGFLSLCRLLPGAGLSSSARCWAGPASLR